jgi:hypothetical protein
MQSAKWRADTFSTLAKLRHNKDKLAAGFSDSVANSINIIIAALVGPEFKLKHDDQSLGQLFKKALELNHTLKAQVLHLGDFHTLWFEPGHPYDKQNMSILDAKPTYKPQYGIITTIGLGVYVTRAVGGDQEPEADIVRKAMVVCENVYD